MPNSKHKKAGKVSLPALNFFLLTEYQACGNWPFGVR